MLAHLILDISIVNYISDFDMGKSNTICDAKVLNVNNAIAIGDDNGLFGGNIGWVQDHGANSQGGGRR